ncbi:hypothetical protein [Arthrobacter sp. UYCu712]|uniref:hypothetical protein n=1 Tax=Arthrobacter sp. UYCu712 TaxID=3156340 RepID=UPI0033975260
MTVTVLFAALALTACSAPQAGTTPSSAAATPVPSAAAATPSKSSGPYGEFPTAAAACAQISEQATGATLLPLSAAQGKTAELEQAKNELARTADMVPDSIKADFARLSQVAVAGVKDQTVFSSGKLQDAMAPVQAWLAANCA